jgi:hypothetical protein
MLKTWDSLGQPSTPTITGLNDPRSVAVAADGTILVANRFAVRGYSQDGNATGLVITRRNPIILGPETPRAVVVDGGRIYIGWGDTVGVYEGDGKKISEFPVPSTVVGIAVH